MHVYTYTVTHRDTQTNTDACMHEIDAYTHAHAHAGTSARISYLVKGSNSLVSGSEHVSAINCFIIRW